MPTNAVLAARDELRQALEQMESALLALDRARAPAQIGAHLDCAISELEKTIGILSPVQDLGPARNRAR